MASEVISSALLMIATIVATVALINAVFPSIYGMSGSITTVTNNVNDQMKTDIKFIYETTDNTNHLTAWVKNIGRSNVYLSTFNNTDLFYGEVDGVMSRATLNGTTTPYWTYAIENGDGDSTWSPGQTLRIDIYAADDFAPGEDYRIKFTLANGAYTEDYFTK
jgi:flagellar protein FlaG